MSNAENDVAAAQREHDEREARMQEINTLQEECKELGDSIEKDQRNLRGIITEG